MDDSVKDAADVSNLVMHHSNRKKDDDPFINSDGRYVAYTGRAMRQISLVLRNPAVRYSAYTSDVGEAFRPVLARRIVQLGKLLAIII